MVTKGMGIEKFNSTKAVKLIYNNHTKFSNFILRSKEHEKR